MDFIDLNVDYLLVNSTNEFLLEYTPLDECSRYHLTGFSGSVGDALVCRDGKIKLFVDGRYHQQADNEVNKEKVDIIKLPLGKNQDEAIAEFIAPNSTYGIVSKKVSQSRFENFRLLLKDKKVNIKLLDTDIFQQISNPITKRAVVLSDKYTGKPTGQKLKEIQKPQIITNSEEISYICNIRNFNQDYAVKVDGKLLILSDKTILFSDTVMEESSDFILRPLAEFDEFIKNIDEEIILDKSTISAYDYALIKKPLHKTSEAKNLKSVKNSSEVEHLKYCFEMTDKALFDTRNFIYENDNLTEKDIEIILEQNFKKYGAKSLSFKSIVALNKNSALAHYSKSSDKEYVKNGDLILIDCGAYYDGGLATDITRVFVKGEPSNLHKKIYTTVLKLFLKGFNYDMIENQTSGFDIDKSVRDYLSEIEVPNFKFSHGLGHGIGICVHEIPPNLSMNTFAKSVLKNNMCFTIEPGLYNPDYFGVRLENSCYICDNKIKSFSNMCYEKKLIDYTMLTEKEKLELNNFEVL